MVAMNLLYVISTLTAFLLALILIPVFRKVALKINLVDKPNARKVHAQAVPLVGGLAIFAAASLALSLALPSDANPLCFKNIYLAVVILLLMGVLDDRFDLNASLKLAIQLILAHFVYQQGIKIESLHGLLGIYTMTPAVQYLLTVVVVAGAVNAFNLMDGIDGLAAGLAIAGFAVFTLLAILNHQPYLALVFLTCIGALIAFLRFNLSKNQKIFMGDAGSLTLGFVLVVTGIQLLQTAQDTNLGSATALGVVAVLLVPVLDALRVFRNRIKSGKSPFDADKSHLHHLVLSTGLKHQSAALCIVILIVGLILIGLICFQLKGLTLAIAAMLLLFFVLTSLLQFNDKINDWKLRVKRMESRNVASD
jgi:UDP-GlcNAc:undecaprenyl-phosphate/decaprenyl-phosphate GlcNAc-1-phosphate transferase